MSGSSSRQIPHCQVGPSADEEEAASAEEDEDEEDGDEEAAEEEEEAAAAADEEEDDDDEDEEEAEAEEEGLGLGESSSSAWASRLRFERVRGICAVGGVDPGRKRALFDVHTLAGSARDALRPPVRPRRPPRGSALLSRLQQKGH